MTKPWLGHACVYYRNRLCGSLFRVDRHIRTSGLGSRLIRECSETVVTSRQSYSGSPVHDLPVPPRWMPRSALATRLGIANPKSILILTAFEKDWPDSCLGLPKEGEICAQAITSGYEVVMQKDGREYTYRTNADGTIVRAE